MPFSTDSNPQLSQVGPSLLRDRCLIGGEWVKARDGREITVVNPSSGAEVARVPCLSAVDVDQAIGVAAHAQRAWRETTGHSRAAALKRWADLVMANVDALSIILTTEQGKPLAEARGEIAYAASFLEWFGEEAKRISGDIPSSPRSGQRLFVLKQPIGVCAAITPWNFPAAMITRKVGPAVAAGCSIIVKPAESTPLTAFALASLALEAGLPPGLVQVVTGEPDEIGSALCASPVVRKLSFTGSTAVGRLLMSKCAPTIKKLSLELGGNAPLIVFDDADIDRSIAGIIASKFRNSGQTCVCANRIYVQDGIYDTVAARLVEVVRGFQVGDGFAAGTTHGPLINRSALQKVQAHIANAVELGAKVEIGGRTHALGGTYFEPTVLTGVDRRMRVAREETFGPLAPLIRFRTEAEVVAQANESEFGLAGYLFTQNHGRLWRIAEALEVGIVGINTGLISNEVGPFGGIKQSGLGREGSRYGIDEYLELKYVCAED